MPRERARRGTGRWAAITLAFAVALSSCNGSSGGSTGPRTPPAAPLAFDGFYYARAVHLSWELGPTWSGESFRIYAKRTTDPNYLPIAEVTNCAGGVCSYRDINILSNVTYQYYVAAVGSGGAETSSANSIQIPVPTPTPPPDPGALDAVPLDGAVFLRWNTASRGADDFAFYRIYFHDGTRGVLIGETDSEGFLDLLAENGATYPYFVTAVDDQGHESGGSGIAAATPRPDYQGEILFGFDDRPEDSGFRFREDESLSPIVHGSSASRHFRIEADLNGWWLVPGPGVAVHPNPEFTTALRCGPAADASCVDLRVAPASGYLEQDIELVPEYTYVVRVPDPGAGTHRYGAVRITHVGAIEQGAYVLLDWAFQLQSDNRNLAPPAP